MAITEPFELDGVTIGTTEWSVTTNTAGPDLNATAGVYQLWVDGVAAMAVGDQFRIKIYEKVEATGGTQRVVLSSIIRDVQTEVWVSPTLILLNGWDMTLTKVAGTDRAFDASVRKVA